MISLCAIPGEDIVDQYHPLVPSGAGQKIVTARFRNTPSPSDHPQDPRENAHHPCRPKSSARHQLLNSMNSQIPAKHKHLIVKLQ